MKRERNLQAPLKTAKADRREEKVSLSQKAMFKHILLLFRSALDGTGWRAYNPWASNSELKVSTPPKNIH